MPYIVLVRAYPGALPKYYRGKSDEEYYTRKRHLARRFKTLSRAEMTAKKITRGLGLFGATVQKVN